MWRVYQINLEPAASLTTTPFIYALPPEVIAEIFKYLVPAGHDGRYDDLISASHTSTYFRQVTTTLCPSLWSVITIEDERRTFSLAKACFKRSANWPLHVRISVELSQLTELVWIIDFVRAAAPRLRRLELHVGIKEWKFRVEINHALGCIHFPILEVFDLDIWNYGPEDAASASIPLPASTPCIRSLTLTQLVPQGGFESLRNLQTLSVWARSFWQWGPAESLLRLLDVCQQLETLRLDRTSSMCHERLEPFELLIPERRIVASSLRTITFREVEGSFMAYLLINIEAPKLRKVEFELEEERNLTHNPLLKWRNVPFHNTFPSVTALSVGYLPHLTRGQDAPDFARCLLKLFPGVKRLELPFRDHTLLQTWERAWAKESMRRNPDNAIFWWDLRELRLGWPGNHKDVDCWTMKNSAVAFLHLRSRLGMPKLDTIVIAVCEALFRTRSIDNRNVTPKLQDFTHWCCVEYSYAKSDDSLAPKQDHCCYSGIGAVPLGLHGAVTKRFSGPVAFA